MMICILRKDIGIVYETQKIKQRSQPTNKQEEQTNKGKLPGIFLQMRVHGLQLSTDEDLVGFGEEHEIEGGRPDGIVLQEVLRPLHTSDG